MRNSNNAFLNIASIFLLFLIFGGLIYLSNASYSRSITGTRDYLEGQLAAGASVIGPMSVDYSVCHYLLPNSSLDSMLGFVLCPSCNQQADWIKAHYRVVLVEATCARRGTNNMQFIWQPQPANQ